MKAHKTAHPKLAAIFGVINHFVKYHGATLNKKNTPVYYEPTDSPNVMIRRGGEINSPNRKQRRAIKFGVKIGKNCKSTPHKLATGDLRRARLSFF